MENKRSLKYLIVAACLALLVASIGGIVVGASDSPAESGVKILGATLDLNDQVSIGYVVDADAVGYEKVDGVETVKHYVHTYDYNPTNDAKEGFKLTNFVYRQYSETEKYVIFLTDGYAVTNYSNNVYARVITDAGVGPVRKAGVYEIANLMLKQGVSSNATKLVNALVKYYDAAYKVIKGTASPYKFVSVKDGYIVGEDGFNYTSGVYSEGTKITLADEIDEEAKGAILTGWNIGGTTASASDVVTVNASCEYSPEYALVSDVDYNPLTTGWYADIATSFDATKGSATFGNTLATKNSGLTTVYWNSVVAGVSKMGKEDGAIAYRQQSNTLTEGTKYVYRDKVTGEPIIYISYDKKPTVDENGNVPASTMAGQCAMSMYLFNSNVEAGEYVDLSFDIMFPTIDKNGNGTNNETEFKSYKKVVDLVSGDEEVINEYGDYFSHNGTNSVYMIRVPIDLANKEAHTRDGNLMYLSFFAKVENGVVTGFYPATRAGYVDKTKNKGSNEQEDSHGKDYATQVFSLDEYHTVTARIVPDDNGNVSAVSIYIGGELIETRTAAAGVGTAGLSELAVNGNALLFGEGAYKYVTFGHQDFSRFNGDFSIKNFRAETGNKLTTDEVAALDTPVADATESVYVADHYASVKANLVGQSTLADRTILGENLLRSYNANASWVYDAKFNSYTIAHTGSGSAGAFNLHVVNPIKNLASENRASNAVTLEFNISIVPIDYDRDGIINEAGEYGDVTSSTIAWLYTSYGDGKNGNATPDSGGMVSASRFNKSKTAYEKWSLNSYGHANGKLEGTGVDSSAVSTVSAATAGVIYNIKMVYYPNIETGTVDKLEIYANDTLKVTRSRSGSGKTGMAYSLDTAHSYNGNGSIYAANYLNICFTHLSGRYCNLLLSDVKAYLTPIE